MARQKTLSNKVSHSKEASSSEVETTSMFFSCRKTKTLWCIGKVHWMGVKRLFGQVSQRTQNKAFVK